MARLDDNRPQADVVFIRFESDAAKVRRELMSADEQAIYERLYRKFAALPPSEPLTRVDILLALGGEEAIDHFHNALPKMHLSGAIQRYRFAIRLPSGEHYPVPYCF